MTIDLFMKGPAVYIPYLLFSLLVTVLAYGAFPMLFAMLRKKSISKKKYKFLCYGVNVLVMFLFVAISDGATSAGPYLLWTWVFSSWGAKKLAQNGVLFENINTGNLKDKANEVLIPVNGDNAGEESSEVERPEELVLDEIPQENEKKIYKENWFLIQNPIFRLLYQKNWIYRIEIKRDYFAKTAEQK